MIRKVSKVGPATLIVSLPSKWAKKNNVKKGDDMEVIENGAELRLACSKKATEVKTKRIRVHGSDLIVRRFVASAYRQGYNEIILEFEDPGLLGQIQSYLPYFMGFEIVEQGKDFCRIKNLMDAGSESFEISLRRIFLLLLSMSDEILSAIKDKDYTLLGNFSLSEATVNKLSEFCKRNLVLFDADPARSKFYYSMVWELEKIGDEYYAICSDLAGKKERLDKETIEFFRNVNGYLKKYYELYYSFNILETSEVHKNKEALLIAGEKVLGSRRGYDEKNVCFRLMKITEMIYNSTSMVFALNL